MTKQFEYVCVCKYVSVCVCASLLFIVYRHDSTHFKSIFLWKKTTKWKNSEGDDEKKLQIINWKQSESEIF